MRTTDEVWEEFSRPLMAYLMRRLPDRMDAEDVLQDIFVKLHTRLGTLRDENRLAPWLYGIARNAISDYYRAQRQETNLPEDLAAESEQEDTNLVAQFATGIQPLLSCLPEKYAQAIQLVELDGLTQGEMAGQAGLSLSGAKSRVQRGRAMLRDCLFDCCHFEFDRRGHPIDYTPRPDCCPQCRS